MNHISLFKEPTVQKKSGNERGDLLKEFSERLHKPIGYVAMRLKGMQDLQTLYHIKSMADQEERRGTPWAKTFYGSIKDRKTI